MNGMSCFSIDQLSECSETYVFDQFCNVEHLTYLKSKRERFQHQCFFKLILSEKQDKYNWIKELLQQNVHYHVETFQVDINLFSNLTNHFLPKLVILDELGNVQKLEVLADVGIYHLLSNTNDFCNEITPLYT